MSGIIHLVATLVAKPGQEAALAGRPYRDPRAGAQ